MRPSSLKMSAPRVLLGLAAVLVSACAEATAGESPLVREQSTIVAPYAWTTLAVSFSLSSSEPRSTFDRGPAGRKWTRCGSHRRHGFAVGSWPPACWRPYAADSPINTPVPTNPRIHPNSTAYVARLLSLGRIGKVVGNVNPKYDWQVPYSFSSRSDPLFKLDFTEKWGADGGYGSVGKSIEGRRIRIPDAARYAGQGSGQTHPDAHLTVIDQSSGWVYDLYHVQSKPAGGGRIVSRWGGRTRIRGNAFDGGEATAWGGGRLAGVVRAQEWISGKINHALYVVVACTSGRYVRPAYHGAARCSDTTDALPAGARLWLDYSEAEIEAAPWPRWKKTLVRAWATYGGYVGDTGGSGFNPIQIESPETYRSFGFADPLVGWARTQRGVSWMGRRPVFDLAAGIDWAGRLRVLDWKHAASR
jgi:hypothetical protein